VAGQSERALFLIDGNSLVYRAFFALPESISTSKGQPTNAIFGFASMLVKIVSEYGVKPTLVVWDAGMSGREEVYSEYKAGRRDRPALAEHEAAPGEELEDVVARFEDLALERLAAVDDVAAGRLRHGVSRWH
jgi:DNA polymerase I